MSIIKPFKALRPHINFAKQIATKPYDVASREEIMEEAKNNSLTFFKVTRSELEFNLSENAYSEKIYQKASDNLSLLIQENILFREETECFYIYELTMDSRTQTGLVCLSSTEEYEKNTIKKHELTRPDKENDRTKHIANTNAQTGNVFLAYKNVKEINDIIVEWKSNNKSVYNFITNDGVKHEVWVIESVKTITDIQNLFKTKVPFTYIADGHHRAASAYKVSLQKNQQEAKGFLTTLFPANQLHILDYNRVIKDLNGLDEKTLIEKISQHFTVSKCAAAPILKNKNEFGMYLKNNWFLLEAKKHTYINKEVIEGLNVSVLQNFLLSPILNIDDPRINQRIDFVGGIHGTKELEKKVNEKGFAVAFLIFPISMEELFNVADQQQIMPPKSTWFEPKLRDGLFTHLIN